MSAPGEPADAAADRLERRARTFRRARLAVVALVLGYFFLPYSVQAWIPVWLPFLAALALEAQYFVGGYLAARKGAPHAPASRDRGPQERDLAELGGEEWRDVYGVEDAHGLAFVPASDLEAEEDEEEHDDEEYYDDEPPDARRSYLRHLPEAAVAVAIVAVVLFLAVRPHGWTAVSPADRARAEALFGRAATAIAGHPAGIVCDTSGRHVGVVQDADGAALVGGRVAYIVPSLCDELYQLAFKDRVRSAPRTGRAIAVLAHEAWHLNGVADEGLANCFAFQSGVEVGVRLGLSEGRARALMREQLAANASDSASNPAYLVPAECRDGGRYDLKPASDRFP